MKKSFFIIILFFFSVPCFAQQKEIVGTWIWQDSLKRIKLFIKKNGKIEQHSGLIADYKWYKDDRRGIYTFSKGVLSITWRDETAETWKLTFKDKFNAAIIHCSTPTDQVKRKYVFVRVIDEEVMPEEVN